MRNPGSADMVARGHPLELMQRATHHPDVLKLVRDYLDDLNTARNRELTKLTRDYAHRLEILASQTRHPFELTQSICRVLDWMRLDDDSRHVRAFLHDEPRLHQLDHWLTRLVPEALDIGLQRQGWRWLTIEKRGQLARGNEDFGVVFKHPACGTYIAYVYAGYDRIQAGDTTVVPTRLPPQAAFEQTQTDGTRVYRLNFPLIR